MKTKVSKRMPSKRMELKLPCALNQFLNIYLNNSSVLFSEFEFPSSLTSDERAYIHQLARELGLRSKSRGWVYMLLALSSSV
jgi:hypothetical protein